MKTHQIRWTNTNPKILTFNSLSCFNCRENYCTHYHLDEVMYQAVENSARDIEDEPDSPQMSMVSIPEPENVTISNPPNSNPKFKIQDWCAIQVGEAERRNKVYCLLGRF